LPSSIAPILTEEMIWQMTVAQLKIELEKRNKTKSETKPMPVACLIEAIANPPPTNETNLSMQVHPVAATTAAACTERFIGLCSKC
jgi:hypothetical protein